MTLLQPQGRLKLGRDAASVIIQVKDDLILWLQRGLDAPFLAGYWAFPGGMVSEEDFELEGISTCEILQRAALRETIEEVGLPLSYSSENWTRFNYVGSWSTHRYLPRQVTAHFFELILDDSLIQADRLTEWIAQIHQRVCKREVKEVKWATGAEMLSSWKKGAVTFAPPTLALSRCLAGGQPLSAAKTYSPELSEINQVTELVQLIPLKTETLPPATHTNCYLVGRGQFSVIDPGAQSNDELTRLCSLIQSRQAEGERLKQIILTHHHPDHVSGATRLKEIFQVPIAAHPLTEACLSFPLDEYLEEGDTLDLGERDQGNRWVVWHTPGHAPGHLCFIHQETRTAIVGDMVAGVGTIIIDPSDGDMGLYFSSLERLMEAQFLRLLPSHGPPQAAPSYLLQYYLDHRRSREARVYNALPEVSSANEGGGDVLWSTLKEIVEIAYEDAPSQVKMGRFGGLAGRSALSHLLHLQSQGRVISSDPSPNVESRWIKAGEKTRLCLAIERVDRMMTTLRAQCPWDRAQTLESLKRYLIEESYEVLEALNTDDPESHQDELGDLFFQILFQSKIRELEGRFTLSDVIDGLAAKLSRRHPHVFGNQVAQNQEEVSALWAQIKAKEKAERDAQKPSHFGEVSILDGVPHVAPALLRAQLIGEKAAKIGFDWPNIEGALAKIDEERAEVGQALLGGDLDEITAEIGDLIFSIVNVCRHLKISPEMALEKTNHTFSSRFRIVEQLAQQQGRTLSSLDIDALEDLWSQAKRQNQSKKILKNSEEQDG